MVGKWAPYGLIDFHCMYLSMLSIVRYYQTATPSGIDKFGFFVVHVFS